MRFLSGLLVILALARPLRASVDPLEHFVTLSVDGGIFVDAACVNWSPASEGGPNGGLLEVVGIPPGATVERALLYWTVLADLSPVDTGAPTLSGVPLVVMPLGELVETPCFPQVHTGAFRADATAVVTGNGTYQFDGLPGTGAVTGDITEGVTLVVAWSDAAATERVTMVLYDGLDVVSEAGDDVLQSLAGFTVPADARLRFVAAIGNGQNQSADSLVFEGVPLGTIDPTLLAGRACPNIGFYDLTDVDVTGLIPEGASSASFELLCLDDCYTLAMAALVIAIPRCASIEPSAVDLTPSAPPLRVARTPTPRTLQFTWEATGAPVQLWQGVIGAWYGHEPMACGLSLPGIDLPVAPDDLYFLAAGCGDDADGGRDSFGTSIPSALEVSGMACP